MATISGSVHEIYQTEDFAWVRIEDSGGAITKVLVYSDFTGDYAPHLRVVHGGWLAMLRTAMVNNIEVRANYTGALMFSLYMNA